MHEYRVFLQSHFTWREIGMAKIIHKDVSALDEIRARIEAVRQLERTIGENDYKVERVKVKR